MNVLTRRARSLLSYAKLVYCHFIDLGRYHRHASQASRRLTDGQLTARLLQKAHSIEKGLSMPAVRPGFGAAALNALKILVEDAVARRFPEDDVGLRMARSAAAAYVRHHAAVGAEIPAALAHVHEIAGSTSDDAAAATLSVTRDEITAAARGDFAALVAARHSARMFSPEPVDPALIEQAVRLTLRTPSVCNRQGGRVHWLREPGLMRAALDIQGGNRGFTEEIGAVLVVTSSLEIFRGASERNQVWVDGGLFAMTLLYALAHVGLGACALNWSASPAQDRRLRDLLPLPDEESIVMLIGVGTLRPEFTVAASPRRALADVLREISPR